MQVPSNDKLYLMVLANQAKIKAQEERMDILSGQNSTLLALSKVMEERVYKIEKPARVANPKMPKRKKKAKK